MADGQIGSECPELKALTDEHNRVAAVFNAASERLRAKIGISDKVEYDRLDAAADVAWQEMNKVRKRLHEHIQNHGCRGENQTDTLPGAAAS